MGLPVQADIWAEQTGSHEEVANPLRSQVTSVHIDSMQP